MMNKKRYLLEKIHKELGFTHWLAVSLPTSSLYLFLEGALILQILSL